MIIGILFFILGELLTGSLMEKMSKYIFIFGGSFVIIMGILMILKVKLELGFCPFFIKE